MTIISDRLYDIVDERVGIIRKFGSLVIEPGEPKLHHVYAEACDTSAFCEQPNSKHSGGASLSYPKAVHKAIGEAIERYCSAVYNRESFKITSARDATFPCVNPKDFILFSDEQYYAKDFFYQKFNNETLIRWCVGRDLGSGEKISVPAAMVYVPYIFVSDSQDTPITQPISTGLACHETYEACAAKAICEVIERDRFMCVWQLALTTPKISLDSLPLELKLIVKNLEVGGKYSVILLDARLTGKVPVVIGLLLAREGNFPSMTVAASASTSAQEAVSGALEELAHTAFYVRKLLREAGTGKIDLLEDKIESQADHIRFYAHPDNKKHAEFLWNSGDLIDFSNINSLCSDTNPAECLTALINEVSRTGYRIIMVDITTNDVRSLGLRVCRAVIPGYQPLFMGASRAPLDVRRLMVVGRELGLGLSESSAPQWINRYPHPFP